jgi:hypothetical protein
MYILSSRTKRQHRLQVIMVIMHQRRHSSMPLRGLR